MKASVPVYCELTALSPALFIFCSLPTPAAKGDGPEKFKERPGADVAAAAPAQARGLRRLVGLVPVVLLVALARGRASIVRISIRGALHAAFQMTSQVSEDLDGEQAVLH